MIGTFLLLAAAIYLGLLSLAENDPVKAGLFLFGAIVALAGAVIWYLDHRSKVRAQR